MSLITFYEEGLQMNLDMIRSFLAVAKYKSLSKAAASLHITQPTLSARIKNTENYFNVQLFERDWQGVRLTNHGLYLLPHAVHMLSKLRDFTSVAENFKGTDNESLLHSIEDMQKTLRIGINNYLAPTYSQKIIDLLVSTYPSTHFEFFTGSTSNLKQLFEYDAVDCIVYYSNHEVNNPHTYLINQEEMVFAFSVSDYELVTNDIMNLKTMNKPLILNSNPTLSSYLDHFHYVIEQLGLTQFQMVENIDIIRQLVEANLGYATIPMSIFHSHFNHSTVRLYQLKEYLPTLSLYLTSHAGTPFHDINKHILTVLTHESTYK